MKLNKPLSLHFDGQVDETQAVPNSADIYRKLDDVLSRLASIESLMKSSQGANAATTVESGLDAQVAQLKSENLKLSEQCKASRVLSVPGSFHGFLEDVAPFFYKRKLTYVDAGAFIGKTYSEIYSFSELNIREAHLFEPNPESYKALEACVEKLGSKVQSCHLYPMGLSDSHGQELFLSAKSMTKVVSRAEGAEATGAFSSKVVSLDEISENFTEKHIDLLKIDVEGFEMRVLKGCQELLKRESVDVVYIEAGLNADAVQQTYLFNIDSYLQSFGYRVFKFYEQKNEWISDSPHLRRCNVAYFSGAFAKSHPYEVTLELYKSKKQ